MVDAADRRAFAGAIDAALALIAAQGGAGCATTPLPLPLPVPQAPAPGMAVVPATALPSLLAQCHRLIAEAAATTPPPLRCLHHLACTGGTLFARCIAALPNTRVLSEVDPLSDHAHAGAWFFPTDLIGLARFGARPPGPAVLLEVFRAGLGVLYADSCRHGLDLVIRDHAHSQFCYGPGIAAQDPAGARADTADAAVPRLTLREILAGADAAPGAGAARGPGTGPETGPAAGWPPRGAAAGWPLSGPAAGWPLSGVVTVRHPLDSYLAMQSHGWLHFTPTTPEEYARRYHAFLDRHADLPWLRYEDLLADPEATMHRLCTALDLVWDPDFRHRLAVVRLSGDSGRSGATLRPRPRRPCPPELAAAVAASAGFARLCARLGYPD